MCQSPLYSMNLLAAHKVKYKALGEGIIIKIFERFLAGNVKEE